MRKLLRNLAEKAAMKEVERRAPLTAVVVVALWRVWVAVVAASWLERPPPPSQWPTQCLRACPAGQKVPKTR